MIAEREAALAAFIHDRSRPPHSPRDPHTVLIADVLDHYTQERLVDVSSRETAARAVINLVTLWGDRPVADISSQTCKQYLARRGISDGSGRRELGVLQAAINWCHREGYLTVSTPVWMPDKPPSRDRWMTRQEAARLLRAARQSPSWYLPIFILIGLYTGARKEAILGLQWTPNIDGGYIDLDRGLIDFRRSGLAQTNKRRSAIPIHPRLRVHLEYARRRTTQYVLEYRDERILNLKKGFEACAIRAGLKG